MTQTTATQTYDSRGIREDLSDFIYNISPTDCPFMQSIGRSTATATSHDWQTDSLAADATDNIKVEGADAFAGTESPAASTSRVFNFTQISDKTAEITGTLEAVKKAGRTREMAYQVSKRTRELKRDMENTLTQNQASTSGSGTVGRQSGGLRAWMTTNTDLGSAGSPGNDGFNGTVTVAATDGTQEALTEARLKNVIKQCWDSGGEPNMIMTGSFNKQTVSNFAHAVPAGTTAAVAQAGRRHNVNAASKVLTAAIDVYESDFGRHTIVPNRFQRGRDCFVLDTDMWAVSYLRTPRNTPIAKVGDAERRQIICEFTLEARNEASSGVVADCTTS